MSRSKFGVALACLLSCGILLHGQGVRINVVSGEERLAYAYIYVNGRAIGVTDTLGVFTMPLSWLHRGDTLSASFVGFGGDRTIYDGETSEMTIDLKANYQLEEVVVSARGVNMLRLLRKHTDFPQWIETRNKAYTLRFESRIDDRHSSGEIKLALSPRLDLDPRYKCISSNAGGDTIGVIDRIGSTMLLAVKITQSLSMVEMYKQAVITSRGIVGDERIFILSYTVESGTSQILLYVDKTSKQVTHFETSWLSSDLSERWNMNVRLAPYGKNSSIVLSGYEREASLESRVRLEKVVNITQSHLSNTWNMFYDKEGNLK